LSEEEAAAKEAAKATKTKKLQEMAKQQEAVDTALAEKVSRLFHTLCRPPMVLTTNVVLHYLFLG
jgi:hypothetical protein